jgi:murein DD-endopeptidase MepM/ murein hydrolase activator NlpD
MAAVFVVGCLAAAFAAPGSSGAVADRPIQDTAGGGGTSLKAEYDEIIGQEAALIARVDAARAEQVRLQAKLVDLDAELRATQQELVTTQGQLEAAEATAAQEVAARKVAERKAVLAKARLRRQIVTAYVTGGDDVEMIEAILNADNGEDAGNAMAYSRAVVGDSDEILGDLEAARAERRRADAAARKARHRAEVRRDEVAAATAAIAQARDEQARLVEAVGTQVLVENEALRDVQGRKALVEGQIASMNRTSDGVGATLAAVQAGQPDWRPGDLVVTNPIPGYEIGSQFGLRKHPILGTVRLHAGGDMGAPSGTTIHAPADGIVVIAGEQGGYGNTVVIDHGFSLGTLYGHQSRIDVVPGQYVRRGDPIGAVGSTGLSTGPHLHFETRLKGVPTDPKAIVDFSRPETSYAEELRLALEAMAAAEQRARAGG